MVAVGAKDSGHMAIQLQLCDPDAADAGRLLLLEVADISTLATAELLRTTLSHTSQSMLQKVCLRNRYARVSANHVGRGRS